MFDEKVRNIKENNYKVYNAGKLKTLSKSAYMHPNICGTIISVNDVTPIEHNVGVKVASKNLFDFPQKSVTRNKWDNSANWGLNYIDVSHLRGKTITYQATIDLTNIDVNNASNYTDLYGCVMLRFYNPDRSVIGAYGGNDVIGQGKVGVSKITKQVPDVEGVLAGFDFRTSFYDYTTTEAIGEDYIKVSNPMVELGDTASKYTPFIADLTGVEVARYEKNLYDISQDKYSGASYIVEKDNKKITVGYDTRRTYVFAAIPITDDIAGKTVTVSAKAATSHTNTAHFRIQWLKNTTTTSGALYGEMISTNEPRNVSFTGVVPERPDEESVLCVMFYSNANADNLENGILYTATYSDVQVEISNSQTEYEPFTKEIYTANADGTVEGVKSISPNMTLIPNNNAVTVECEYLRDIDLYIDNLMIDIALRGGN